MCRGCREPFRCCPAIAVFSLPRFFAAFSPHSLIFACCRYSALPFGMLIKMMLLSLSLPPLPFHFLSFVFSALMPPAFADDLSRCITGAERADDYEMLHLKKHEPACCLLTALSRIRHIRADALCARLFQRLQQMLLRFHLFYCCFTPYIPVISLRVCCLFCR